MGSALSRALADHCRLKKHYEQEDESNLQRVALFYEIGRSRKDLVKAIAQQVEDGKRPSSALQALAELDLPLVITTNYDTLLEQALRQAGKEPRVSIRSMHGNLDAYLADLDPKRPIVVKLHGDIGHGDTLVVTDEDYIDFVREMTEKEPAHPFPLALREMLMEWTTLFIGYSLADYNLRLLFRTLRWRIDRAYLSVMYSVDRNPDVLIREVWERERRYLRYVVEDVWDFVPKLYHQTVGKELLPA
ncbi:MAG: SIR2 family NAD-dependent protein deacylase [Conexibacter sp.]